MTPANDNTPAQRPAEFDAHVMAHRPMVENMAKRWIAEPHREDFVQDVLTFALSKWRGFRNLDTYADFTAWMRWQVRSVMTTERKRGNRERRRVDKFGADYYWCLPGYTPPAQEATVTIADSLAAVRTDRYRSVLIRRAMGEGLGEIGCGMGIGSERVRQIEEKARAQAKGEWVSKREAKKKAKEAA